MNAIFTRSVASLVAIATITACADDQNSSEPDAGADAWTTLQPHDPDVYPVDPDRPRVASCTFDAPPASRAPLEAVPVFSDLLDGDAAQEITHLRASPIEDGRWYVTVRGGRVYTFTESGEEAHLVLDLADRVTTHNNELGLFSVDIDPRSADAPMLYLTFAAPHDGAFDHTGTVSRFPIDTDSHTANLEDEMVVFEIEDPAASHNLNQAAFGPDEMLYLAIGDGGNPYDRFNNGQNTETLFAGISRIDPRTPSEGRAYSIPSDNPFAEDDAFAPELYAYGLRNPWRITFDAPTGDLWAGDVGQDTWEEANRIVAGGNYGWSEREGPLCFRQETCEGDFIDPVWAYTHAEGASVTIGPVIRDPALPALDGHLVVSDFANGAIWTVNTGEMPAETALQLESGLNPSSFEVGHDGAVYFAHFGGEGQIYKLAPSPPPTDEDLFPRRLSETGCVNMEAPDQPAEGMIPYAPVATLWSDGAEKSRFMRIPADRRVGVDEAGDFLFPVGSVLVKNFGFGDRVHETRLLVHHGDGWRGYSYRWDDDGLDATLLESGFSETLPNDVPWTYPGRRHCNQCHTQVAGVTLGLEYLQLADNHPDLDVATPQLPALRALAVFNEEAEARIDALSSAQPGMPAPYGDAPVDERARAYLHANCAGCHQPGGPAQGDIDLRYTTPFADMMLCGEQPTQGRLYRSDGDALRLFIPGDADHSILLLRMETLEVFRMPALGSTIVDTDAAALIRAWVEATEACP